MNRANIVNTARRAILAAVMVNIRTTARSAHVVLKVMDLNSAAPAVQIVILNAAKYKKMYMIRRMEA